jgi:hypothetical protein
MAKEKASVRTSMFSRSVQIFSTRAQPATALTAAAPDFWTAE